MSERMGVALQIWDLFTVSLGDGRNNYQHLEQCFPSTHLKLVVT